MTRKGLRDNARIFNQVGSLRRAGYDVVLLGVRRGALPARESRDGVPVIRVSHDPLPDGLAVVGPQGLGVANDRDGGAGAAGWHHTGRRRRRAHALHERRPARRYRGVAASIRRVLHARRPRARSAPRAGRRARQRPQRPGRGALHARRHACPLIYDAQELFTGVHTLPRPYRALLRIQERWLLRAVDRLLIVNPAIAAEMERLVRTGGRCRGAQLPALRRTGSAHRSAEPPRLTRRRPAGRVQRRPPRQPGNTADDSGAAPSPGRLSPGPRKRDPAGRPRSARPREGSRRACGSTLRFRTTTSRRSCRLQTSASSRTRTSASTIGCAAPASCSTT